ncbi:hypothetical protein CAOG_00874 [Capsaspora owczarzaki ATCC 30864]|uniref:Uncharacterized protein n=1 Tax=Capsaspora owczarzaki (strain ATCC 30864) TaxID=595528 RepID=A0A0D2U2F7_CAPO3|nr:hypothetical protein CAOG_00874 [Capsaspora owczarzaki ATCC 30864]KJE89396.1 hypothetical protein CAOG_000874 [Capsaspora owczarzaki ATCC 30864]|eukprot:XP_004365745.1 hypothetical protein CAOG_00874 [Capsaspora owczarzaki ATCC 30864]
MSAEPTTPPRSPTGDQVLLSKDQSRLKLERQLQQFELEVQSKVDKMNTLKKMQLLSLSNNFKFPMLQVPRAIKQMKLREYLERYGDAVGPMPSAATLSSLPLPASTAIPAAPLDRQPTLEVPATIGRKGVLKTANTNSMFGAPPGTVKKGVMLSNTATVMMPQMGPREPAVEAPAPEMAVPGTQTRSRVARSATVTAADHMRPSTVKRGAKRSADTEGENAVTCADVMVMATPSMQRKPLPIWGATPLQTPRGDARPTVAQTPVVRVARAGETVMSINGSPLAVLPDSRAYVRASNVHEPGSSVIILPLENGRALELDPLKYDPTVLQFVEKESRFEAFNRLKAMAVDVQRYMDQLRQAT